MGHRRNQSQEINASKPHQYHRHHQSSTFADDGVLNMSNIAELTQNESELTQNEITPAPIEHEIGEEMDVNTNMNGSVSGDGSGGFINNINVKQKRKDIKKGGTIDTINKLKLLQIGVER